MLFRSHRDWDSSPARGGGSIPNCELVLVLKDVSNHKLRDWARDQARALDIKFCEVSQKIAVALDGLRHVLGLEDSPTKKEIKSMLDFGDEWGSIEALLHNSFLRNPTAFAVKKTSIASRKKILADMASSYFNNIQFPSLCAEEDGQTRVENLRLKEILGLSSKSAQREAKIGRAHV